MFATLKTIFLALCLAHQLEATSHWFTQASGHFGNSIWTDQPYARVGLYGVPNLAKSPIGLAIQEEAFFLSDNQIANSVGLEFRVADKRKTLCGINAFYDLFKGHFGIMNQVGVGFEILTPTLCFHVNGYLPFHVTGTFGKTKKSTNFVGPFVLFKTPSEFLYQGLEFTLDQGYEYVDFYLYGSAGAYYIDDFFKSQSFGFQGRGEVWWHPFLYMGFLFTHDTIFKNRLQGYMGISIPFDSVATNCLPVKGCCDYLCGRGGKMARIPRWGLGCPGCGALYKINWKPKTCCKND